MPERNNEKLNNNNDNVVDHVQNGINEHNQETFFHENAEGVEKVFNNIKTDPNYLTKKKKKKVFPLIAIFLLISVIGYLLFNFFSNKNEKPPLVNETVKAPIEDNSDVNEMNNNDDGDDEVHEKLNVFLDTWDAPETINNNTIINYRENVFGIKNDSIEYQLELTSNISSEDLIASECQVIKPEDFCYYGQILFQNDNEPTYLYYFIDLAHTRLLNSMETYEEKEHDNVFKVLTSTINFAGNDTPVTLLFNEDSSGTLVVHPVGTNAEEQELFLKSFDYRIAMKG